MDNAGPVSVTPTQMANLVSSGVKTDEIIRSRTPTQRFGAPRHALALAIVIAVGPDLEAPPA